jgi:hypothetical protein
MRHKESTGRDLAILALLVLALAVPLMPVPGDYMTRVHVRFHAHAMAAPRAFTARTLHSVCTVLAAAVAYDDPRTGHYTRISCGP